MRVLLDTQLILWWLTDDPVRLPACLRQPRQPVVPSFADHKDPFDRLLVAQSLTEPLTLLTVDRTLARYGATVRLV